ncbi:hypothetical protein EDWATA_01562 [Edwardsiella tarda ATCC 23685]|uniref:Uncharacterized protein n=1 Tax=Edwardsiella tarda ATCC 23685 TaxID=500638 RepID=D4F492_EDWTA|nr:hypothetical protein EDWATA_01562 [Edwardsiella tarda ATCC 23685]
MNHSFFINQASAAGTTRRKKCIVTQRARGKNPCLERRIMR